MGASSKRVKQSAAGSVERSRGLNAGACLSEAQILSFVTARLERREIALVDRHLRGCPACEALAIEALHVRRDSSTSSKVSLARCAAFEPGTVVGRRYCIRRFVGHGGMGDVYEAVDRELSETVALKMARATVCDDPESSARLSLEVKLARRVLHPNVCRVHDVGVHLDLRPQHAQTGFISMEYIDGESLARRLEQGPLPLDTFGRIAREILLGVSAIHAAGVIHRALESHNTMLRRVPRPSMLAIIDFGLAVHATEHVTHREELPALPLEGSPAYMAPEQFHSIISPASDLFACGVILCEALTGRLPFRELGPGRVVGARRDPREVPLRASALAPHVPRALDDVVARCLELDPVRRYRHAPELLADLERALRV